VNRITAFAFGLAIAACPLTTAETKRETMGRKVRTAIAEFQGTVRLYAKNLDTGEMYGSVKTKRSAPPAPSSCPSWWRSFARLPTAMRTGMRRNASGRG
jgi:hypothetical protein